MEVHGFCLVLELGDAGRLDGALEAFEGDVGGADVLGEELELAFVELDLDGAVQDIFLEGVFRSEVDLRVVGAACVVLGERGVRRPSLR